jgi:hypothetical protein
MRTFPLYESMIHDMTLHGYGNVQEKPILARCDRCGSFSGLP